MSEVIVQCPKCQTQLRVNRPAAGEVQFQCTKCGQVIKVGSAAPAPAAPSQASILDSLPPAGAGTAQPARPASSAMPPRPRPARKPRKTSNGSKPVIVGIAIVLGLGVVGAIGYFAYQALPTGAISQLNPLGDSPDAVVGGLLSVVGQTAEQMESIKDETSRDAAIENLSDLVEQSRELQKRAIRLGTVSESKRKTLVREYDEQIKPLKDRLKIASQSISQKNLRSRPLLEASVAVSFAISDVGIAMNVGWMEMPPPQDKWEELEYGKAIIDRDVWRAIACVTTEKEYQALPQELADAPDRYRKLAPLQKEVAEAQGSATSPRSPYRDFTFDFGFQKADKLNLFKEKYGESEPLKQALLAIDNAQSELIGIKVEVSNEHVMEEMGQRGAPLPPMPKEVAARMQARAERNKQNQENRVASQTPAVASRQSQSTWARRREHPPDQRPHSADS